jgi:hypothetical protein
MLRMQEIERIRPIYRPNPKIRPRITSHVVSPRYKWQTGRVSVWLLWIPGREHPQVFRDWNDALKVGLAWCAQQWKKGLFALDAQRASRESFDHYYLNKPFECVDENAWGV